VKRSFDQKYSVGLLIVISLLTMTKGFRPASGYALGQWLLTYENGFVKRGLIGTLASPFYNNKTASEIGIVVNTLSSLVLGLTLLIIFFTFHYVLSRSKLSDQKIVVFSGLIAFASSFFVLGAHTNGFFDHFLEIFSLLAILCINRNLKVLASVLLVVSALTHEIFLLYGLPVVCFALFLKLTSDNNLASPKKKFVFCSIVLIPVLTTFTLIAWSQHTIDEEKMKNHQQSFEDYRLFDETGVQTAIHHIRNTPIESMIEQKSKASFVYRVFKSKANQSVVPATVLLMLVTIFILAAKRRWVSIGLYCLLVMSPMLIHLLASDTARFKNFHLFHAFAGMAVAVVFSGFHHKAKVTSWIFPILAIGVMVNSITCDIPLFGRKTAGDGPLSYRSEATIASFKKCHPVFPNANFEKGNMRGWKISGLAFNNNPHRPSKNSAEGRWLAQSHAIVGEETKNKTATVAGATGQLVSEDFVIVGKKIIFYLKGADHRNDIYVSLNVDGEEVCRDTGNGSNEFEIKSWDVEKYRGKKATIKIVDNHTEIEGHLDVDGFCYCNGV
jgi:hypothetical protein